MPSARGDGDPALARGVLPRADEGAWPFSSGPLLLVAALASAIAACTCMHTDPSMSAVAW